MKRLSLSTLAELPAAVARPAYDPGKIGVGVVHLGIGAFHRAQTAVYSDDALALERGDWGICGVSLRSPDVRDRLAPQDGLYTAVEKSPAGIRRRVIGSVREVRFLGDERDRRAARLAAPATRIVSLTITEKGYCHDPATGRLNLAHPDIVHDLVRSAAPAQRDRPDRRSARRAPALARRAGDDPVLRQPAAQRRAGARTGAELRRSARSGVRAMDRRSRELSLDDGRSHRASDDRSRRRGQRRSAGPARRGAGRCTSRSSNGSSRMISPPAGRRGSARAPSSSTTSRRSKR